MLDDKTHLQATRNRLLNARKIHEREVERINEALAGIDLALETLSGLGTPIDKRILQDAETSKKKPAKIKKDLNVGFKAAVIEYITNLPPNEKVEIPKIVEHLRSKGLTGDYKSLYSYTHIILRREAKKGALTFAKGQGYHKVGGSNGFGDQSSTGVQ